MALGESPCSLGRWITVLMLLQIFIIEGVLTCVIAIIGYIYLVGFPDQLKQKKTWPAFLTHDEIDFVIRRINKDRSDAGPEEWNFRAWAACGADPKVWGFALIFWYDPP